MTAELLPLKLEADLTMQKILEAADHRARCKLLNYFMAAETKRLESKKSLKAMFSGVAPTAVPEIPKEEMITTDKELPKVEKGETVSSIAKKYTSSVTWIINANQIVDPKKVNVGKELFIPQN